MSVIDANRQLVLDFFATWNRGFDAMVEGFRTHVAPECLFLQTRTPDLHGLAEIIPFLEHVRRAGIFETVEVVVDNLIVTETHVVSQRTDRMIYRDGSAGSTFPCVGVMTVGGGKITGWRDYFDSADMQPGEMDVVQAS